MNHGILLVIMIVGLDLTNALPINKACDHLPYDFHNLQGEPDYFFLRYELTDAQGAKDYCNSIGMDLPSIQSKEQNDLINRFLYQTNIDNGFFYTAGKMYDNGVFYWSNGDTVGYTNFDSAVKFNPANKYVVMNKTSGKWVMAPGNLKAGIICHVRC